MTLKCITALIPNANNAFAESIRKRTCCKICNNRIENGQKVYDLGDESHWDMVHTSCYDNSK